MHDKPLLIALLISLAIMAVWRAHDVHFATRVPMSDATAIDVRPSCPNVAAATDAPTAGLPGPHLTTSQPGGLDATGVIDALHTLLADCR